MSYDAHPNLNERAIRTMPEVEPSSGTPPLHPDAHRWFEAQAKELGYKLVLIAALPALSGTAEFETLLNQYVTAERNNESGRVTIPARQAVLDAYHRGQTGLREAAQEDLVLMNQTLVRQAADALNDVVGYLCTPNQHRAARYPGIAERVTTVTKALRAALSAPQQEGDKT